MYLINFFDKQNILLGWILTTQSACPPPTGGGGGKGKGNSGKNDKGYSSLNNDQCRETCITMPDCFAFSIASECIIWKLDERSGCNRDTSSKTDFVFIKTEKCKKLLYKLIFKI